MRLFLLIVVLLPILYAQGQEEAELRQETRYQQSLRLIQDNAIPEQIPILKQNKDPLRLDVRLSLLAARAEGDRVILTVQQKLRWKDEHVERLFQERTDLRENISTSIDYLWRPDIAIQAPADETRLAARARALVDRAGIIRYEPRYICEIPVNGSEVIRGARVQFEYKSSSYNAQDLHLETTSDGFDSSLMKIAGFGVRDLRVEVQNPPPDERDKERSLIRFSLTIQRLVVQSQS